MRALVVYCHPKAESFTAAVRDRVLEKLRAAGADVRLVDLYAEGFDPILSPEDLDVYVEHGTTCPRVLRHCNDLKWCDTLIFVYPTWWYGLPAMLKGWLDRVLVPGTAFEMPQGEGDTIRPGLQHISRLGVFTTCGASFWLTRFIGAPGRRTLLRGVRVLMARRTRTVFAAHYLMDSAERAALGRHLDRVSAKMDKLIGRRAQAIQEVAAE